MPELPEVETVRRQLHERLKGCELVEIEMWRRGRVEPTGSAFVDRLMGRTIRAVERRAKLLVWRLDQNRSVTAHLKMTGHFTFVEDGYEPKKHDRILFVMQDVFGQRQRLVWSDMRQFGFMHVVTDAELSDILSEYGPEPLESSSSVLAERLNKLTTRSVKSVLLDQAVIAGIGNIYADEALFRAGIRPSRQIRRLTVSERERLAEVIKTLLKEAVEMRGTTAHDYADTMGNNGGFLSLLRVYDRKGEPCLTCKTLIKKVMHAQRGTHFCPSCQK